MIEYKGKTITVDNTGMFVCGNLTASSIAAMKKKIDLGGEAFVPFKARADRHGDEFQITGIRKQARKYAQQNYIFTYERRHAWKGLVPGLTPYAFLNITDDSDIQEYTRFGNELGTLTAQIRELEVKKQKLDDQRREIEDKYRITADEYAKGKRPQVATE